MIRKSTPPLQPARQLPAAELLAMLQAMLDPRQRPKPARRVRQPRRLTRKLAGP